MIHSATGLIHTLAALCALLIGAVIFFRPKRTSLHRVLGHIYSLSMLVMLATAFCIYHLTKSFNFLHVFAIISCPPLVLGFWAAFRRGHGWIAAHYGWMCFSYLGLCEAFVAEMATRLVLPYLVQCYQIRSMAWFWSVVGVCSYGVFIAGGRLIRRNKNLVEEFQRV